MTCTDISSGTRVSLTYVEEAACGVTPIGLNVDVTSMLIANAGSGDFDLTRPSGSFIVDGYLVDQWVETSGFVINATNDGTWKIKTVTALTITVYDPTDISINEVLNVANTVTLTMATLRATGRSINLEIDTLESEEVRPSRQFSDVRHGFNQVTGSPGFELSNVSYSDFIRGAMSGAWEKPPYTGGVLTYTFDDPSAGIATLTRTTDNWVDDGYRAGDMVFLSGFTPTVNNGTFRVLSVLDQAMTIDTSLVTGTGDNAAGTLVFPGYRIDIGLNLRTYTMEQRFDDIVQYRPFRGVAVNGMSLNVTPESIAGGSWEVLGMSSDPMDPTSLIDGNLPIPAPTTAPFAAFQGRVYENGIPIAVMTSMELTLDNQRTLEGVIGSKFSPGVFEGRASVNGTMVFFLRGNTTYNKFVNETETSVWMRLQDPNSVDQFANIVMHRVKFTTGDMDPPTEGPVPINMGFRSLEVSLPNAAGVLVPTSLSIQSNPIR
jgi:hypothetical protein